MPFAIAGGAELPDLGPVPRDLAPPLVVTGAPAPGRRVRMTLPAYAGTEVHHTLYLPSDWRPGGRYPVFVEYAGNGPYSNRYGDTCSGLVEYANLGYGLSGGTGFVCVCLPFVASNRTENQRQWWGDLEATVAYAKAAVRAVCRDFGGDSAAVFLAGFSRGAIAVNYVGLHDDEIAGLWRGFICHSHYDGVRRWNYPDDDRASAARRLARLGGRPQFISQEGSVEATRRYLAEACPTGRFTFVPIPFRNHTDAWTLCDLPERAAARAWLRSVLDEPSPAPPLALPATGRADPAFRAADEALVAFMTGRQVRAAAFAVSRDGRVVHERAFGFDDPEGRRPVRPDVRLRLASVTKPFTAAVVRDLAARGKLSLDDAVLKFLPAPAFPAPADPRWRDITLRHLLDHRGGWNREAAGDPMFMDRQIGADLGATHVGPREVVRWMLGRPLQFDPGRTNVYSNFGYALLGVVIEQVTGCGYREAVQDIVGARTGGAYLLSGTGEAARAPGETWYDFGAEGERFRIEVMPAHGGLVGTAADLCRFLEAFWISGEPREARAGRSYLFYGSMPGTSAVAVQRPDGLSYAILLNRRAPREKLHELVREAVGRALPGAP